MIRCLTACWPLTHYRDHLDSSTSVLYHRQHPLLHNLMSVWHPSHPLYMFVIWLVDLQDTANCLVHQWVYFIGYMLDSLNSLKRVSKNRKLSSLLAWEDNFYNVSCSTKRLKKFHRFTWSEESEDTIFGNKGWIFLSIFPLWRMKRSRKCED